MHIRRDLRLNQFQGWETPLILLGVVILSYGLWIPWLGLFGDDLSYLYYYHLLGAWGPGLFASDRPISALFYAASMSLLGENVLAYQVLLVVLRWLSAVLLWWVLGLVWPERKREASIAAILFAVYPGFRQNPIALEFILHFFVLDLFLLSLGTMLMSICRPKWFWRLAVVSVLAASSVFMLEYFIGLEILRPIFLWITTRRAGLKGKAQWKRILLAWVPVLLVVIAFLFWRVFIFAFPGYKPVLLDALRTAPLSSFVSLVKVIGHDLWVALVGAWVQTVHLPQDSRSVWIYLGLAVTSITLVGLCWWRTTKNRALQPGKDYWGETMLLIGLAAMLAGGSIFWLTAIPVSLAFPWDRSTLAFMLGASLVTAGLLEMLVTPRYLPVLASGLIALAIGMHFVNAQEYHFEWAKLQDFYWQLAWRAPQLEPGTLALFDVIPLNRYSDNDMTAMLNWMYAPDQHSRQIAYKFFDLTLRLDSVDAGLPGLEKGLPLEHNHRGLFFKTTTSSTIALTYTPPACLKVLDPQQDALLPSLPERITQVLPMTSLNQIRTNDTAARPPRQLGPEPAHGWCYYFQKADLAHQQKNWSEIAVLGDQAAGAGLHPGEPSELLPFIEGYALSGKMDQARALSQQASRRRWPAARFMRCLEAYRRSWVSDPSGRGRYAKWAELPMKKIRVVLAVLCWLGKDCEWDFTGSSNEKHF